MANQSDFTLIGDVGLDPQSLSRVQQQLGNLQKYAPKVFINTNLDSAGKDVSQFSGYLDRANQRVIAFTSSVSVLYSTIKFFKDIVSSTIEVDKALASINSTMKLSSTNLDKFSKDLFNAARATSSTFGEAAEAAQSFARQGLGMEETLKRTKDALTLSRIAGIDAAESVTELTNAVNIFQKSGISTTDVVRGLSAVSSNFAVSTKDISDGFTRFGAVAQSAGLSFTQTIALITALKQSSQRDGAAIGTALTSIFEKLQPKTAIDSLRAIGVVVKDTGGNLLPTIGIVQSLAKSYDGLSEASKAVVDKLVGGSRQIEILKSGFGQLSSANSAYVQAQKAVASGADDVTARLNAQNQSISALLQNFGTAAKQIQSNIGQLTFAPLLKGALGGDGNDANPITKALEDASGNADTAGGKIAEGLLRGIGDGLIFGLGPILLAATLKISGKTFSSVFRDVADQAGIVTNQEKQATIQKQIIGLYRDGGEALQTQLKTMSSITEQAALLSAILQKNALTEAGLAKSSFSQAGVILATRSAAGGYLSVGDETAAIAAGVGGAPASAHAVVIPNFRYGPGKTGPIVANSSEYLVNLGSGDAIYNQEMIKQLGLPDNARPIAAGGYIPRAAVGLPPFLGPNAFDPTRVQAPGSGFPLDDALIKTLDSVRVATQTNTEAITKQTEQAFRVPSSKGIEGAYLPGDTSYRVSLQDFLSRKRGSDTSAVTAESAAAFEEARQAAAGIKQRYGDTLDDQANYLRTSAGLRANGFGGGGGIIGGDITAAAAASSSNPFGYNALNSRLRSGNAGLIAALALPFAGGVVDQFAGPGGTAQGEGVGALSGALKGAGSGAGFGLIVGQPLAGAAIGAAIGGITGALNKASKSFEELADEVATRNNDIKKNYDQAAKVFELQGQITDALRNGDKGTAARLVQQQNDAIATLANPHIKDLLVQPGALQDPTTQARVNAINNADTTKSNTVTALKEAALSVLTSASPAFRNYHDQGGFDTFDRTTIDPSVVTRTSNAVSSLIPTDPIRQKALLSFARNNPQAAFELLQRQGGLTEPEINSSRPGITTNTGISAKTIVAAIEQAIKSRPDTTVEDNNQRATKDALDLEEKVRNLAQSFQLAAKASEILNQAYLKVTEAVQKTTQAVTLQTEQDKLDQQAAYDQANIKATFAGQRQQTSLTGAAEALDALNKGGVQDKGLLAQAGAARSISDFQALQTRFGSDAAGVIKGPADENDAREYKKSLSTIITKLQEINTSETASLFVAKTTNDLLKIQKDQESQDRLTNNARFDTNAFASIQGNSRQGNSGSSRGSSLQSLINEQGDLSALGIPDTEDSLDYLKKLQTARTRETLAQIAGNRLGTNVGISDESLGAASDKLQSSNNPSNVALGSRIAEAIRVNGIDSFAAIQKVQSTIGGSPADFKKALSTASLSTGDQLLTTGFNDVTNAISGTGGTNDLLTDLIDLFTPGGGGGGATGGVIDSLLSAIGAPIKGNFFPGVSPVLAPTIKAGSADTTSTTDGVTKLGAFVVSSGTIKQPRGAGLGNFGAGFSDVADKDKAGLQDLFSVGQQVAEGITSAFDSAWDRFATGSEKAGKAFKSFVTSITADASKAFADQAFKQLFSGLFGSQGAISNSSLGSSVAGFFSSVFGTTSSNANGGPIGFATGGKVPAMLTGGEFYVSPSAAKAIGYDKLGMINKGYAGGGLVYGGSGMKDDVPASLPQGSYIIRKSSVQRYGAGNLQAMVNGRANGGRIGFDGGGFVAGSSVQDDQYSDSGDPSSGATAAGSSFNYGSIYSGALALALQLIMGWLNKSPGLLDTAQTTSNAERIRNYQQNEFLNPQSVAGNQPGAGGSAGGHAYLTPDGNGGYKVINYGGQAATVTNFSGQSDGGPILSMPGYASGGIAGGVAPVASSSGGGAPNVGVQVTVHNYGNGNTSSSTQTNGGGGDVQSQEFAKKLGEQMQIVAKQTIVDELRSGGVFGQKNRFAPAS